MVIVLLLAMLPFTKQCIVIGKQVMVILKKKIPRLSTQKNGVYYYNIIFWHLYCPLHQSV